METEKILYFNRQTPIILDGFYLTGKDDFKDQILPGYTEFHFLDDSILTFITVVPQDKKIVFTDNIFSELVRDRVLHNTPITSIDLDIYRNTPEFTTVPEYVYLKHASPESAQIHYEDAVKHGFSLFKSFDNYWIYYVNAHEFFKWIYKELKINPRVFEFQEDGTFQERGTL